MEEYSAFSQFIGKYGSSYATKDVHMAKFETFRANYRDIKAHNEQHASGELTWTKVVNQFADLTADEFDERYLSAKLRPSGRVSPTEKHEKPHLLKASHVPDEVDWWAAGKVSESVD